ncbi:MAG: hypothetical protein A2X67_04645 [Ignavibacteria bacterium GWA2_55_11]|nr:MAG: hypothetical protein A2X67_04645 [Ignavibacteria bacterium GWA2_55_11]OGU70684.1 MAG: hypothetical protein A3G43_12690 [Ignavibacteria bacterium RIFCSPLOWO2_12_FULL_56_21]
MSMKVIIGAVVVVLAVVVLALTRTSSPEPQRGGGGSRPADRGAAMRLPVDGIVLQPQVLDNKVYSTGNIMAAEEVELRSEVSGKITQISFREGSHVAKGDLLVKINDSELRAQLQRAMSQKTLVEEKEFRQRKLREINAISQEQYDETRTALAAVTADMSLLKAQLLKTEIRAPFEGIVGLRFVSEGSYVTPTTLVARMQDIRSVKIDFAIPEKYASKVAKGNNVRFSVEGLGEQFTGHIYAIEPKIDPSTRTLRLRATAVNQKERILPGSFTKVEVLLNEEKSALLVPTHALIPELGGQTVFVSRGGLAHVVKVETGIRTEGMVQILGGLQPLDTLITTGLLQLRHGSPVTVRLED